VGGHEVVAAAEWFAALAPLCCAVAAWAVEEKATPPNVSAVAKRKALRTNNINLLRIDLFLLKKTSGKTENVVLGSSATRGCFHCLAS
jgi:hypothetical protein